jgi:hypothetical protein
MAEQKLSPQEIDAELLKEYPLVFLEMNEPQERFIRSRNKHGRMPRRRLLEAGNKVGKTFIGIGEDIAHAIGYRPWLVEDDPERKIDIPIPNVGGIGCETMAHSVVEKLEPTLKQLIPKTCYPGMSWRNIAKKNPQGYLTTITIPEDGRGNKCESKIHLRSYDQDPDTFEGIDYHWWHWDEPPPQKHYRAVERGKIVTNAPSWFTMTPLKEPYIYDELSLKAPFDEEIDTMRGEIWDNCMDWCYKCNLVIEENKDGTRKIAKCPNCGRTMGFIPKAGIDEYLKTLPEEEREAREKGIWRHLSGLVYKTFSRDEHIYEDQAIPRSWMKIEGIDPHDANPTCYMFGAVCPEEIDILGKRRNRIYWFDHLKMTGGLDSMIRQIKVTRETHGYQHPKQIMLDAKYGERTQLEGRCWETELRDRGIGNIILSQSKPGDVELGHKIVREYLKSHYSILTGQSKPGMMFARNGCGGQDGPIHHITNYQYKEGKEKPSDQFKDFPDIIRYVAMEEPIYQSPEDKAKVDEMLREREDRAVRSRRQLASM